MSRPDPDLRARDPNAQPVLANRRPDMVVCRTCYHFREKVRGDMPIARRHSMAGRPPSDWRKECVWFHSERGRAATPDQRLTVMLAGANGGVGCTEKC